MATATASREGIMEVAGARYGVLTSPAMTLDRVLYSGLGTRDPAHIFVPKTAPLVVKTTLYIAGRDKADGLNEELRADNPESF